MGRFPRSCRYIGAANAAAILLVSGAVPLAHASFPGRNGVLSVTYGFDCAGSRVATLEPDGRHLRMLTPSTCEQGTGLGRASWSPDGRHMSCDRELPLEIASNLEWTRMATMRSDGTKLRDIPLTSAPALSVPGSEGQAAFVRRDPTFAPDGRHVLYSRTVWEAPQYPGDSWSYPEEIWLAALDGSHDHRFGAGRLPRMSPNGRRIAYV